MSGERISVRAEGVPYGARVRVRVRVEVPGERIRLRAEGGVRGQG